ncbi:MAG: hypothetical protein JNJ71_11595 [Rubrivivax sp.]|nr:hypothetical protein [Rubrivivax sp.]
MTRHLAYRHTQTYTVLWLILIVAAAVTVPATMGSTATPEGLAGVLLVLATFLAGLLLLGRLVIEVDSEAVRWSFGYVGWPAWQEPLKSIVSTELGKANVAFGSGIKGTAKHRQFNVVISGPALRLHLMDGRSVTLGTPEPQRLQGFIEARRDQRLK